jgi:hypothetical protein
MTRGLRWEDADERVYVQVGERLPWCCVRVD